MDWPLRTIDGPPLSFLRVYHYIWFGGVGYECLCEDFAPRCGTVSPFQPGSEFVCAMPPGGRGGHHELWRGGREHHTRTSIGRPERCGSSVHYRRCPRCKWNYGIYRATPL